MRTPAACIAYPRVFRMLCVPSCTRGRIASPAAANTRPTAFRVIGFSGSCRALVLWRRRDETLHRVKLTEGYWLAETACAQSLWESVTGKNPSRFKGGDRPVENVSRDDVQGFMEAVNKQVPGLYACLPTEAEWEYAARAGTKAAFWFGESLTTEKANYNGNRPYVGGEKGESRKETVSVKRFEANLWGLYQVHGNVWEWCEDSKRRILNSLP